MPTTLLAVDDSVTMRKVLEMTFAGEDVRVITADAAESAFAKLRSERPAIVLADVSLEGLNGYGLCARIKSEAPTIPVILLASKQAPYDSQKGAAARADDFIEKPFDTQQLIDKVRRLLARPAAAAPAPSPVAQPTPAAIVSHPAHPGHAAAAAPEPPSRAAPAPLGASRPAAPPLNVRPPAPTLPGQGAADARAALRGTLAYSSTSPQPRPAAPAISTAAASTAATEVSPPPSPVVTSTSISRSAAQVAPAAPVSTPRSPAAAASPSSAGSAAVAHLAPAGSPATSAAAAASAVGGAVNGALAAKLADIGLSDAQAQAVLALSREVVERVVWEVVPVLAETLIKEEIQRLTKE